MNRRPMLLLLLAALLLRGLLPLGFMPGAAAADGSFGLVLCTAQGLQASAAQDDGLSQAGAQCPYGFALEMAGLALPPAAPLPAIAAETPAPYSALAAADLSRHAYRARAPPALV